jgi:hypothetical protein
MTIWDFANKNGFGLFLCFFLLIMLIRSVSYRIARTRMVKSQGWPPSHLDADGDFKSEDEQP